MPVAGLGWYVDALVLNAKSQDYESGNGKVDGVGHSSCTLGEGKMGLSHFTAKLPM